MREHIVKQRLRAKLQHARHELRERVRVQGGEEGVAPRDPDVASVEPELQETS